MRSARCFFTRLRALGVTLGLLLLSGAFAAANPADTDWAVLTALQKKLVTPIATGTPQEKCLQRAAEHQAVRDAALAFLSQHPADARRWDAAVVFLNGRYYFARPAAPGDEFDGVKGVALDEAARAAYETKAAAVIAAILAAPAAPEPARFAADARSIQNFVVALDADVRAGRPVDWEQGARALEHVASRHPSSPMPARWAQFYTAQLEKCRPADVLAAWQRFAGSTNTRLRELAGGRVRLLALGSRPLEIAFAAVDGRPVDLRTLRGKVVLVDFWATWCGPCIAELPNVKKVYAAYRDKGFEVVGIALENGGLMPTDTPEQTAARLAKAKKVLTDFTAREQMPWPQYFDGKYWKNDISTRYGIASIPAMFLLDQEGRVVSTNARGPELEQQVKRLLKL